MRFLIIEKSKGTRHVTSAKNRTEVRHWIINNLDVSLSYDVLQGVTVSRVRKNPHYLDRNVVYIRISDIIDSVSKFYPIKNHEKSEIVRKVLRNDFNRIKAGEKLIDIVKNEEN